MTTRVVTAEDIIAAAERNGYVQSKNGWFAKEYPLEPWGSVLSDSFGNKENPIVEACFMGQIAINLGVDYREISNLFQTLGLYNSIVTWNDEKKESYNKILGKFKNHMKKTVFINTDMRIVKYYALTKEQVKAKKAKLNGI